MMTIEELMGRSKEELEKLHSELSAEMAKLQSALDIYYDAMKWRSFKETEMYRSFYLFKTSEEPVEFSKKKNLPKGPATVDSECLMCKKTFTHYRSVPSLYCSRTCYHGDIKASIESMGTAPKWGLFQKKANDLSDRVNIREIFPAEAKADA